MANLAARALPQDGAARIYRLGGEEFAVILPGVNSTQAHTVAERIRQAVLAAHIDHGGNPLGAQTVSAGTATVVPTLNQPALSLLAQSDRALYAAKHKGRNRCEAA